ncbi:MAG: DUF1385 domain-containing protein [Solirubrobacterales bacterium]
MSSSNGSGANGAGATERPQPLRLGGMALRNGLLVHGPTSWAVAARDRDGEIQVASGPKPVLAPDLAARVPLLRGPLKLAEAFMLIPTARLALRSARLPFEDPRVLGAMVGASALSRTLRSERTSAPREMAQALLGLAPALVALSNRDLAAYHGAEHKAIGAYEQGIDPASATKEHSRCGSNLIAPMLVCSVAGQLVLDRVLERPGALARGAVGIAGVSLAAELFAWSERNPDTAAARAFRRPGHEIQRVVATKEPTPEQLEVGVAAMREILRVEQANAAG